MKMTLETHNIKVPHAPEHESLSMLCLVSRHRRRQSLGAANEVFFSLLQLVPQALLGGEVAGIASRACALDLDCLGRLYRTSPGFLSRIYQCHFSTAMNTEALELLQFSNHQLGLFSLPKFPEIPKALSTKRLSEAEPMPECY